MESGLLGMPRRGVYSGHGQGHQKRQAWLRVQEGPTRGVPEPLPICAAGRLRLPWPSAAHSRGFLSVRDPASRPMCEGVLTQEKDECEDTVRESQPTRPVESGEGLGVMTKVVRVEEQMMRCCR